MSRRIRITVQGAAVWKFLTDRYGTPPAGVREAPRIGPNVYIVGQSGGPEKILARTPEGLEAWVGPFYSSTAVELEVIIPQGNTVGPRELLERAVGAVDEATGGLLNDADNLEVRIAP